MNKPNNTVRAFACLTAAFFLSTFTARAEVVDLTHCTTSAPCFGTITGAPGGTARFEFMTQQPTGTGVIQPFLRVQNTPVEQGYNTSGGTPWDDKPGPWTHNIQIADLLPTAVNVGGVTYFKLLLDVNEPGGKKSNISLDQLEFFTSPTPDLTAMNLTTLGTLRFSFKLPSPATGGPSSTDYVLMNAALNSGSGSGDMYAYIPVSAFGDSLSRPTDYVYMYVYFGAHSSADLVTSTTGSSAGGFEEWALVRNPSGTPTPTPTPTPQPRPTPMQCDVVAAEADSCYPFSQIPPGTCFSGHVMFLPNADCDIFAPPCDAATYGAAAGTDGFKYIFTPGSGNTTPTTGLFDEDPAAGTATLTGHLESTLRPGYGFDVVVNFSGRTSATDPNFTNMCPGNPFLELDRCCYVVPPPDPSPSATPCATTGTVDPSTWYYYTSYTGTLTGTGNYDGLVLTISPTMHCFEVGVGASGKNQLPGASGWFMWTVSGTSKYGACLQNPASMNQFGDFNFNCTNPRPRPASTTSTPTPTPTPTPAPTACAGVHPPSYWLSNPNAWCMSTITVGGRTYTEAQALTIVQAKSTDMTYAMATQLGAAKLNQACSHSDTSCVSSAMTSADNFLRTYPVGSKVSSTSTAWKKILTTYNTLVNYNSGKLCAPLCN